MPKLTVREFFKRFPNDETCLEHVMSVRYGLRHDCQKCGTVDATFHRLAKRPAYSCASCGAHVYPCAGTVFQDTRTPLTVWFYVIFLFVTTRHGVSAKEIQRQIGVTYKTAWRMGHQIRTLLANVDEWTALRGHVELDETLVGGKAPKATQMANALSRLKSRGCDIKMLLTQQGGSTAISPAVVEALKSANIPVKCTAIPMHTKMVLIGPMANNSGRVLQGTANMSTSALRYSEEHILTIDSRRATPEFAESIRRAYGVYMAGWTELNKTSKTCV